MAAIAGLLPGISGSVIWLASGQYPRYIGVINQLVVGDLIVFILGSFLGYVVFSVIIEHILKRYPVATYTWLSGLTLASILWLIRIDWSWSWVDWFSQAIIPVILGFSIFYAVYRHYQHQKRSVL